MTVFSTFSFVLPRMVQAQKPSGRSSVHISGIQSSFVDQSQAVSQFNTLPPPRESFAFHMTTLPQSDKAHDSMNKESASTEFVSLAGLSDTDKGTV